MTGEIREASIKIARIIRAYKKLPPAAAGEAF
jgi:hypothetical protein